MTSVAPSADAFDVTVVVPTRNERSGIGRFLGSIPDSVKLVVVDSSDDDTVEVIESVRPTTQVISAHLNIPEARQRGAEVSTSRWILFTDADVIFAPDYFTRLAELDVPARVGGIVGVKRTVEGYDRYHRWFLRGQRILHAFDIPAASGSNMLVRRAALTNVGGFDPRLRVNEDSELMFRIARAGWKVPLEPELAVMSFDHRRLELGVGRKLVHGAVRNTALYLGVFEQSIRRSDWGYWQSTTTGPMRSAP